MDRSTEIILVSQTAEQGTDGVWREEEKTREVFAQVNSVTRAEFFEGGRSGLNPEYRFTLFAGDYEGEKVVVYNGERYAVYRTYIARTDDIELYVERQGGING